MAEVFIDGEEFVPVYSVNNARLATDIARKEAEAIRSQLAIAARDLELVRSTSAAAIELVEGKLAAERERAEAAERERDDFKAGVADRESHLKRFEDALGMPAFSSYGELADAATQLRAEVERLKRERDAEHVTRVAQADRDAARRALDEVRVERDKWKKRAGEWEEHAIELRRLQALPASPPGDCKPAAEGGGAEATATALEKAGRVYYSDEPLTVQWLSEAVAHILDHLKQQEKK